MAMVVAAKATIKLDEPLEVSLLVELFAVVGAEGPGVTYSPSLDGVVGFEGLDGSDGEDGLGSANP